MFPPPPPLQGIYTLFPYINARRITISVDDVKCLLTEENPFLSKLSTDAHAQAKKLGQCHSATPRPAHSLGSHTLSMGSHANNTTNTSCPAYSLGLPANNTTDTSCPALLLGRPQTTQHNKHQLSCPLARVTRKQHNKHQLVCPLAVLADWVQGRLCLGVFV